MKKIFLIQEENKNSDRLVESIKHEIRKYLRRERGKALPEGADLWDFDCRFAVPPQEPAVVALADVMGLIDGAVAAQAGQFYLELLARPAQRPPRPQADDGVPPTAAPYLGD